MIEQIVVNISTVLILGFCIWWLAHSYFNKETIDGRKKEFAKIDADIQSKPLAELVDQSNAQWAKRNNSTSK